MNHLEKAHDIMRYLSGYTRLHMIYDGRSNEGLIAHTYSDWALLPYQTSITTGFSSAQAYLASSKSMHSRLAQNTVATLPTEAKYTG